MNAPPPGALREIDWNEVWKYRQKQHDASLAFEDATHDWSKKENAERYAENAKKEYDNRIRETIEGLTVDSTMRVLDIGGGPGTLAIPLAPRVRDVTVVEPGAGMVAALKERAAAEGITNITCVQELWEAVDPALDLEGPYNLVIASLSLTMQDIRAAICAMNSVCEGIVALYWFVTPPFWEKMYDDLVPLLFDKTYYPGPKADCLYNVLYQMGIYANVQAMPLQKEYRFASRVEMTEFFRKRFAVTTPDQKMVLDDYLSGIAREEGKGVVISGDSVYAKLWWKVEGEE